MRIAAIRLLQLPPFDDVMFDFPKKQVEGLGEVHIITGQNGTGKTRLLSALASVLGNPENILKRTGATKFDFRAIVETVGQEFVFVHRHNLIVSGTISELRGRKSILQNEFDSGNLRQIDMLSFRKSLSAKNELFSAFAFRGTTKIFDFKVQPMKTIAVTDPVGNLDFDRADQSEYILQAMTNLKMGSAMEHLSWDIDGSVRSSRATEMISRIENAVSIVSGKKFAFEVVPHPEVSIRVRWGGKKMSFGVLPDGLRSIIGFLVSCASRMSVDFPEHENPLDIPVIILMDEPETHLHPAWQQRLIPAAQHMLPNSQMFVVTHSPFVVSSVNSGYVHVLTENDGKVTVSKPMECSKGDTWVDAVEDALGLKTWYDPETEALLEKFRTLREHVLAERGSIDELKTLASSIASRSNSLSQMMGKEMAQVKQLLDKPIVAK